MEKLTILSVFHSPESKKLLELNFKLVQKLNLGTEYEWVVADNMPEETSISLRSFSPLQRAAPRVSHIFASLRSDHAKNGEKPAERNTGFFLSVIPGIQKAPDNIPDWIKPSFHHNIAMNMSIPHIKTRFALFLDSDFYILQIDWINKMIDHMQKNNLTFMGTPWHPKIYRVFRYFPCHQCLFVDFNKLRDEGYKKDNLDFTPLDYENVPQKPPAKKFGKLSRILNIFNFKERYLIGKEKHTAHRLFEKFSRNHKIKFEIIPAIFKPGRESYPALNLIYSLNKLFELFLPDRLCYIPKNKSYYSTERFKKLGFCDAWGRGWEEYAWQKAPFGIHVRPIKQIKKGQTIDQIIAILKDCFFSFNINP
ncbi:MAG: hypothetical protein AAB522_03395 [Patescibacteria group bacterium]